MLADATRGTTSASRRRQAGICIYCGKVPADAGKASCTPCRVSVRDYYAVLRNACRADGICIHCRDEPAAAGKQGCDGCLAEAKRRVKNLRQLRKARQLARMPTFVEPLTECHYAI